MTATIEAPASTEDVTTEDVTSTPSTSPTVQVLTFAGSVNLDAGPGLAYGDTVTFLAAGRVTGRSVRDFYPAGTARISTDVEVTELVTLDGVDISHPETTTAAPTPGPIESRVMRSWYGFRCFVGGIGATVLFAVTADAVTKLVH